MKHTGHCLKVHDSLVVNSVRFYKADCEELIPEQAMRHNNMPEWYKVVKVEITEVKDDE